MYKPREHFWETPSEDVPNVSRGDPSAISRAASRRFNSVQKDSLKSSNSTIGGGGSFGRRYIMFFAGGCRRFLLFVVDT